MSKNSDQLQRIRVRRDGTDASGAYWGAGPDVFIATSADGTDQITVRARTLTEARAKIVAECQRAPTAPRVNTDTIGGNAPRKTRYEISWQNPLTNEAVSIRITHSRDYLASGTDHIEVESIRPKKAPLPITETGYRSHFLTPLELMNAGGPATFVAAWLETEARGKSWTKFQTTRAQGDLFSWAEAQSEIGRKKRRPKTSHSTPTRQKPKGSGGMPSRRRRPVREPE